MLTTDYLLQKILNYCKIHDGELESLFAIYIQKELG